MLKTQRETNFDQGTKSVSNDKAERMFSGGNCDLSRGKKLISREKTCSVRGENICPG